MNSRSRFLIHTLDYIAQAIADPVCAHHSGTAAAVLLQAEIDRTTLLRPAKAAFVDLLVPSHYDYSADLLRADCVDTGGSVYGGRSI